MKLIRNALLLILSVMSTSLHAIAGKHKTKQDVSDNNPYSGLRDDALKQTRADMHLPVTGGPVYGVVTDISMDSGYVTIPAYATGDASMYLSTGGGFIGVGHKEGPAIQAKELTALAAKFLPGATLVSDTPLPQPGHFTIYLLTDKGIYRLDDLLGNYGSDKCTIAPLFDKVNMLIHEIRKVSGK